MKTIIYTLIFLAFASMTNAQWVQMSNGMGTDTVVGSLASIGNNIFAGTLSNGVYLSTNYGESWNQTTLSSYIESLTTLGNNIFAGTALGGVYISTNNGTTWSQTSLGNLDVLGLTTLETNIFAGIALGGAYLSTNNGTTWTYCGLNGQSVYTFAKLNNNLFAGRKIDGVYLSTNNGTSWTQTSLNNRTVHSLATLGNNIFAGSDSGVYLSTNNGTSWTRTSLNNQYIFSLSIIGTTIFAGATYGGFYFSTNNGTNWIQKNEGFTPTTNVNALQITNSYIFAGTFGKSVWRRPLSEIIGIQPISNEVPNRFSLSQNYPNPFNPTTKIRFSIPLSRGLSEGRGVLTQLIIYDILGREVATLVNEQLNPGTYEVDFDGSSYTSGLYFYKLSTESYTETKKMVLLK